jgi:hypothetical protein
MDRRCSFLHCAKPSDATLGDHEYCRTHFILTCYRQLEESPEGRRGDQENEGAAEVQGAPLLEIINQATSVGLSTNDLTNQERAQLIDILLWAIDLLSGGRR